MKFFASDNASGVAPEIMQALINANQGHVPSYGNDAYTKEALELLKETFGADCVPFLVYNGTAANVLGLSAILRSHHAIIASDIAHIGTQEVGAFHHLIGCSIISVPHQAGKITAEDIDKAYEKATYWGRHANLPKVVSVSQTTELGTMYFPDELRAISAVCRKHNMLFHMDGCRLSNAAAAQNLSLRALSTDVGVDVLSFGGTKNGLMFGEVIVFLCPALAEEFAHRQKQELQLNSKMRFLSAQFIPYLKEGLWKQYATQANQHCQQLAKGLLQIPGVKLAYPHHTNQLFVILPQVMIDATRPKYPFHLWDKTQCLGRFVTSFDTTSAEVDEFIRLAQVY